VLVLILWALNTTPAREEHELDTGDLWVRERHSPTSTTNSKKKGDCLDNINRYPAQLSHAKSYGMHEFKIDAEFFEGRSCCFESIAL
jgi:hypothetical protein